MENRQTPPTPKISRNRSSMGDGRNLISLHIDDVGKASLQRHAPVGSDDGQIAGVEEAVLEEGSRRRFVIEIVGRPAFGADPHPSNLSDRHGAIEFVDDSDHATRREPLPTVVLGSFQWSEGDAANLSGSEPIEETFCIDRSGPALLEFGS